MSDIEDKEMFVSMIMDMLIIIDLDGVAEDKGKEDRMKAELLNASWEILNKHYDQANKLVEMRHRSEKIDKILKEVEEMGVDAVRKKYRLF